MYDLFEVTTSEESCLHLIQLLLTATLNDKIELQKANTLNHDHVSGHEWAYPSVIKVFRNCLPHTPCGTSNDCKGVAI